MSETPTTPGYYVATSALTDNDPFGANVWVLEEDGIWFEYAEWATEDESLRNYPEGFEVASERYGWTMKRLIVG